MRQPRSYVLAVLALSASIAAQAPPPAAPQPFVLTHVNVVDVAAGTVRPDEDVTIRDGRIASVAPSGTTAPPAGVRAIDAKGKFLIPGLADMHIHWYDERYLGLFVANGVTSVRLMWGFPMTLEWRKRIDAGALLGPRFTIASAIVDGPNPIWPGSVVAGDAAAGRAAVEQAKRDGYDFVKVYSRLPPDAYFAIAKASRDLGIPFAGHVPSQVSAIDASDAGQRTIEHNTGVLVASSGAEPQLREEGIRLLSGGEAGQGIPAERREAIRKFNEQLLTTYTTSKAAALFARLVKNGTWMCPTLTVLRSMASLDDAVFTSDPRLKYMPKQIRDSWNPANDPRNATKTAADYAIDRRVFRKHVEIVGAMKKAGVRILAGTDTLNPFAFPGFSLHDELALLVEAGLTPADALRSATIDAAAFLGTTASSGTIDAGKNADLVLLDASPLDDVKNTRRIAGVVVRGRFLDRAELDGLLAAAEKYSKE
jgi:Amidohydrolase family